MLANYYAILALSRSCPGYGVYSVYETATGLKNREDAVLIKKGNAFPVPWLN